MKISGFTFIRNGVAHGYPFVPSIRSLLPLCDEVIANVPRSTDDTLAQFRATGAAEKPHWQNRTVEGLPGMLILSVGPRL